EIGVLDLNDPEQQQVHETYVTSPKPLSLRIFRGHDSATAKLSLGAGNADVVDVAGHGIAVTTNDGSCPLGTLVETDFNATAPGAQNFAAVAAASTRTGKLLVNASAASFAAPNRKSPVRCIAAVTAYGPSGDSDASNNVAWVVVDVVDANDR